MAHRSRRHMQFFSGVLETQAASRGFEYAQRA
jgi:hypothetical protein